MVEIVPAVIGQNFGEIREKLARVGGLVTWAQLDIMDGLFVPEYGWQNPADLETIDSRLKLEVHLMVEEPETMLDDWLKVCDRIIIHYESTNRLDEILKKIKETVAEPAVALLLKTPLEKLAPFMAEVRSVQLMSIAKIGHHGEPLAEAVYEKIKLLRAKYPSVKISVDGGVNLANAPKLIAAGADRLIVGSTIWQAENINETINALRRQN